MNKIIAILVINLAAVMLFEFLGWLVSLKKKNVTIADSMWGAGFIIITWLTFILGDGYLVRNVIITVPVTIWGLRLSYHITRRSIGKPEDPRYTEWRNEYGNKFPVVSLFRVFLVQGLFMWLIALSIQLAQLFPRPESLTLADYAGLGIWVIGFIIESSADRQLAHFIKDPANRGRVMRYKLWRYSRHPNYFGEATIWWGIYVICCATEYGFLTIISPMLITYTLLKITGVSLMEQTMFKGNAEYEDYKRTTSSFIPWFPGK
ncbi:MAG: DUF1295 domain-containing protein [Spirochaetes bacterium]|nr:DUF1295 domain-containing protein [Spirochaetota bacterium]